MRKILHVDMDSFFATVEQQANPYLRGKPVVVCGGPNSRAVITAASIEAKKKGVKTPSRFAEAKAICPDIIPVPGDFKKYVFVHDKLISILRRYSPCLEVFSIDEAFLDLTKTHGRFGGVSKIAQEIKKRLNAKVGDWISCSIGVAPSKVLAKLASSAYKPNGYFEIEEKNVESILKKTPIEELCGVGNKMKIKLNLLGIYTSWDLAVYPEEKLVKRFGINGHYYHALGQGRDLGEIAFESDKKAEKSFGHTHTFALSLDMKKPKDEKEFFSMLLCLSEKAALRMRRKDFIAKTITLGIRFNDFTYFSKRKTFKNYFFGGLEVFERAKLILKGAPLFSKIRLIGISLCNLKKDPKQNSLLKEEQEKINLLKALDKINEKWGEFTVKRGYALYLDDEVNEHVGEGCALQRTFRL